MRVALYGRVSTVDRDQDPETQLMALRNYCAIRGWEVGRPRVIGHRGFERRFGAVLERLSEGDIPRRQAAQELGIGFTSLKCLVDAETPSGVGD